MSKKRNMMDDKDIDTPTDLVVPFGQVVLKPRVIGRNRPDSRYFYAHSMKELPGVGSYTTPVRGKLSAVSYDGFKTPGTLESAILEKHRSRTMKTTLESIRSGLHPRDLVHQSTLKLNALQQLIYYCDSTEFDVLNSQDIKDGLFMLFTDIKTDLSIAVDRMEGGRI